MVILPYLYCCYIVSENTESFDMNNEDFISEFIQHCGEMGSQWGFNRTIGQVFALLLLSEEPITAQEIVDKLFISRGNVSMAIKELQSWKVLKISRVPEDRKDYYSTLDDIWEIANAIFEERRRREVEPTMHLLNKSIELPAESIEQKYAQMKMEEVLDLLSAINHWSSQLQTLSQDQLLALMKLGRGVHKLLSFASKSTKKKDY